MASAAAVAAAGAVTVSTADAAAAPAFTAVRRLLVLAAADGPEDESRMRSSPTWQAKGMQARGKREELEGGRDTGGMQHLA